MRRIVLTTLAVLATATPASAAVTLTKREAVAATKFAVEPTAALLDRNAGGSAYVSVTGCRVAGRRGVCRVTIKGTSTCSAKSHVLETAEGFVVWLDGMRCR